MDGIADKVYLVSRDGLSGDQILRDKVTAARRVEVLTAHEPVEIHGRRRW